MLDNFRRIWGRDRAHDPMAKAATDIFAQHSAELMEQARNFIQEQATNPSATQTPPSSEASNQGREPNYTDFVRMRRASIARQLVSDSRFGEWRDQLFREQEEQNLLAKLNVPQLRPENRPRRLLNFVRRERLNSEAANVPDAPSVLEAEVVQNQVHYGATQVIEDDATLNGMLNRHLYGDEAADQDGRAHQS